jgi:hypothetical protein
MVELNDLVVSSVFVVSAVWVVVWKIDLVVFKVNIAVCVCTAVAVDVTL